jgi:hypothetical protein
VVRKLIALSSSKSALLYVTMRIRSRNARHFTIKKENYCLITVDHPVFL